MDRKDLCKMSHAFAMKYRQMGISTSCQGWMQANMDIAAHGMNTREVQLLAKGVFSNPNQCPASHTLPYGWDIPHSYNLYFKQMRKKVYYWAVSETN